MTIRELSINKIDEIFSDLKLSEELEKSIYNSCISYSNENNIQKKWDNTVFKSLYNEEVDKDERPLSVAEETLLYDIDVKEDEVLPPEARGVKPPDWKVVDENDKPIESKTGYQLENNIENVVFEGPTEWQVKLKTRETIWAPREEVQKYITKDPNNVINYL